ncbi:hypothetical protein [uncultured Tateyamaria sp.]|uniref:hypothetical protein n=1 Tax=Tateyamaria sp. 1078 TaxID=3417464 RepID=UPI00262209FC|nr:hypothetical protein [uncultured Tateyamaria sp.]
MTDRFELRRRVDGRVYRFVQAAPDVYRRTDQRRMTICRDAVFGWVALDPDTGALAGRLWDVPAAEQGAHPPEGRWVSCKGARSYVYDLVRLRPEVPA